jgi:hypothetical protein
MMSDPDDELTRELRAALELDQDERAYLAGLNLAATWRAESTSATSAQWGRLVLIGVVTAFVAWSVAAQPFGGLLATANQVGLAIILLTTALGFVLDVAHSLLDLSTNPALGLTQPLLAVLALAVLAWPRITSAPNYFQGVHS